MLVIRRTDGQWVEVTHRSGDTMRFRVYDLSHEGNGRVHLAFDDPARNFLIQRPERAARPVPPAPAVPQPAPAAPEPTVVTAAVEA